MFWSYLSSTSLAKLQINQGLCSKSLHLSAICSQVAWLGLFFANNFYHFIPWHDHRERWFEPTSVKLQQIGTFDVRSTDWATAPRRLVAFKALESFWLLGNLFSSASFFQFLVSLKNLNFLSRSSPPFKRNWKKIRCEEFQCRRKKSVLLLRRRVDVR